jgi:GDP-mannose 6-dehydrogenase
MKISIFGLGYVGCVSAACFARDGHEVIGVDVSPLKVDIINGGRSPIVEPGVDQLIAQAVREKHLKATTDSHEAVLQSDLSMVCVGTPGNHNGSLDLTFVKRVCREIGESLASRTVITSSLFGALCRAQLNRPSFQHSRSIPESAQGAIWRSHQS